MQVVVLTLDKIQFKDTVVKFPKVFLTLKYGDSIKSIPKPRFIRNKAANFYGQRLSVGSYDLKVKQVSLQIVGQVSSSQEELLGTIEISVSELSESQGTNIKFKEDKGRFSIEFQAMISSQTSTSPRALNKTGLKSDRIQSPFQKSPISNTAREEKSPITDRRRGEEPSNTQQEKFASGAESVMNKIKALEKAEMTISPKRSIQRQSSNLRLNRSSSQVGLDEDRKSQISERPVQKKFQRVIKIPNGSNNDFQPTNSESGFKPNQTTNTKPSVRGGRERSVTPTRSIRSDRSIPLSSRGQVKAVKKTEQKPEQAVNPMEYLQYMGVSFLAFIVGVAVKQW